MASMMLSASPATATATPILPMATHDPLEQVLIEKIEQYLASYVYENAVFLAERLVAHHRTEEHIYLLATCYVRAGRANRAIAVLEKSKRPANRYLLAVCCFQQRRFKEAETALLGLENAHISDPVARANIPNGAVGFYLMGRICQRLNRRQQAIECFEKSLEMDPFLWSAYEELCELGADIDASRFFGLATYFADDARNSNNEMNDEDMNDNNQNQSYGFTTPQTRQQPESASPVGGSGGHGYASRASGIHHNSTHTNTNTPRMGAYHTPPVSTSATSGSGPGYRTPVHSTPNEVVKKPRVMASGAPQNPRLRKTLRRPLTESDDKHRRNARLSFSSAISEEATPVAPTGKPPLDSPFTPVAMRLFNQKEASPEESAASALPSIARRPSNAALVGQQELLRLLSSFGAIYQRISTYLCKEALELLQSLPSTQRASGWAQHQIGRAHFEMADYNQAHDVFRAMHKDEPHRMDGLDLYSTTLWHLKKEVELSHVAQEVTEFDYLSPEAWCVAGNCFSLQREHDTALAFFQRAIQLNPAYTYAYTLSGHEYVANEDFEKAISCYRHAIRIDPRHYNAWYGLGTIYYRQEKFEFAEYHFKRALEINPRSSLLHCFLGMVLHSTRKYDEALHVLAIAGELQPLNPQARFQRANVLITMHRLEEAFEELCVVRNFAPRESSVHFMMGKVAKKLGRTDEAMRCFTTALFYHPKDNNMIKSAIDKINEPDLDDDDRL